MEKENLELMLEQFKKELRLTRIFCVISSMLTVFLLMGGFLLFCNLEPIFAFLQDARPVMEQMAALDIEEVNHTLEQVNATLGSVDWQQVSDSLNKLDVEAINTAIQGLDTKELSKAIENLNKAVGVLESLGEKFRSFVEFLGFATTG